MAASQGGEKAMNTPTTLGSAKTGRLSASVDASFQGPFACFDRKDVLEDPYHSEMNQDVAFKEGAPPLHS